MNKFYLSIITILVVILAGCGGVSNTPDSGGGDPATLVCSSPSLSSNSGQPLDAVGITGVAAPPEALLAAKIIFGAKADYYAMVRQTPEGMILNVPLHPNGTLEGGEVTLSITDGTIICDPMPFTIEALPAAPGTMKQAADLLEDVLSLQAQLFGTSLEELQTASAEELPPHLLPLFSAHLILTDPRNLNSVQAILDGSSATFNGVPEETNLVDALMAKAGIVSLLERHVQELQEEVGTLTMSALDTQGFFYTTTPDAPLLDTYMRLATFGELATDPDAVKYLDAAGAILAGGAAGFTAVGEKGISILFAEVGGFLFAYQKAAEGFANLMPSEFTALTFEVTKEIFWEDDDILTGRWGKVQVYAKSKGWKLDKFILEMMLNWAGQDASGGVNAHKWLERFTSNKVFREIVEHTDDFFTGILTTEIINATAGDAGLVEIEPQLFGPTNVGEQEWSERYFLNSSTAPFRFVDHHTYEAVETGIATLEVMTEPGKFGYKQIKRQVQIQMLPIEVYVTPSRLTVKPGDFVTFTAEVANANDQSVTWHTTAGYFDIETTSKDGNNQAVLVAPSNEALYPIRVTARSASTSGLRSNPAAPVREGLAVLQLEDVDVPPEPCCSFELNISGPLMAGTYYGSKGLFKNSDSSFWLCNEEEPPVTILIDPLGDITGPGTYEVGNYSTIDEEEWEKNTDGSLAFYYAGPLESIVEFVTGDGKNSFVNDDGTLVPLPEPAQLVIHEYSTEYIRGTLTGQMIGRKYRAPNFEIISVNLEFTVPTEKAGGLGFCYYGPDL